MVSITELAQQPNADALVTLFQLDATMLGDESIRCFTSSVWETEPVTLGGLIFTPIDLIVEGFEWSGQGAPPTPTMRIANTNSVIGALARDYGDLVGATVTRIRTFRTFLDDGATPDPNMRFPVETFRIDRKSAQNKTFIEFELAVPLDQEGRMLPGRQCLRDTCQHTYRRWTGTQFNYTKATCPYAGSAMFDRMGQPTTKGAEDRCGRQLGDCILRFGQTGDLPTRAFPGLSRTRR